ncbi:protein kinase [Streptomyces sp. NPDC092370]|uniref:serine/threonine-protein kinase n=1 Tax=Streptomyces sp. NPDC092370 TaxID=3366016 RepID=UPI0038067FA2
MSNDGGGTDDVRGRIIGGRYRLIERIGSGGTGSVWRAHDEVAQREVAVKQPRLPGGPEDESHRRAAHRLHREARAAARVDHPAAVTIHDVVVEAERRDERPGPKGPDELDAAEALDGLPWIVMELVPGESLHETLRRGPVDATEAARIGLAVLGALRAAHSVGIVHRDVKPANVLLGPDRRVVVTDFGIAQGQGEGTLTACGESAGSLEFVAPERMSGRIAGPASDLWSLGVLLYAAVEGSSPFLRTTPEATLAAIPGAEPPEPKSAGPLGPLIARLLVPDPGRRPDAEEVAKELEAVARPTSTQAAPQAAEQPRMPDEQTAAPFGPAPAAQPGVPAARPGDLAPAATPGVPAAQSVGPVPGGPAPIAQRGGPGPGGRPGDPVPGERQPGAPVPAVQPGGLASAVQPGVPAVQPGGLASPVQPGVPAVRPDGPAPVVQPGVPAVRPDGPASVVQPGVPAARPDGPAPVVQPGVPAARPDGPAPAVQPDPMAPAPPAPALTGHPGPLPATSPAPGPPAGASPGPGPLPATPPAPAPPSSPGSPSATSPIPLPRADPPHPKRQNLLRSSPLALLGALFSGGMGAVTQLVETSSAEDAQRAADVTDAWTAHPEPDMAAVLHLPRHYRPLDRSGGVSGRPRTALYGDERTGAIQVRLLSWDEAPASPMDRVREGEEAGGQTRYTRTRVQGWEAALADTTYLRGETPRRVLRMVVRTGDDRMYELRVDMPKGTPEEEEGASVFQGAQDRLRIVKA